jgi:hypothetical protein
VYIEIKIVMDMFSPASGTGETLSAILDKLGCVNRSTDAASTYKARLQRLSGIGDLNRL